MRPCPFGVIPNPVAVLANGGEGSASSAFVVVGLQTGSFLCVHSGFCRVPSMPILVLGDDTQRETPEACHRLAPSVRAGPRGEPRPLPSFLRSRQSHHRNLALPRMHQNVCLLVLAFLPLPFPRSYVVLTRLPSTSTCAPFLIVVSTYFGEPRTEHANAVPLGFRGPLVVGVLPRPSRGDGPPQGEK